MRHAPGAALVLVLASAASSDDCLDAARGIGDFLVESARKDGEALYWPQYEGGPPGYDAKRDYPVSFYSGVAGVGFFLLNLHRITGDEKYLAAAHGAGLRLARTARPAPSGGKMWEGTYERKGSSVPEGEDVGLYSGNAGIGLFLWYLHEATRDKRFAELAREAFERILEEAQKEKEGTHWVYGLQDVIGGEAGIGLALIEMHRRTGDAKYLEVARDAGRWLVSQSTRKGDSCAWTTYGTQDASFSHGVAGIAFFLLALREERDAGMRGARWVEAAGRPCDRKGLVWDYYAGEPPEGKRNWVMNSWCHGAPGIVRLFLLIHRLTGDARALENAKKGAEGIRVECKLGEGKPVFYNPSYCCGSAGCLDAMVSLYEASRDPRFLEDARRLADATIETMRIEGRRRLHAAYDDVDAEAKEHPYFETGFMLGNSGIGYALLRLSAVASGKADQLLPFPDQPSAHGERPEASGR